MIKIFWENIIPGDNYVAKDFADYLNKKLGYKEMLVHEQVDGVYRFLNHSEYVQMNIFNAMYAFNKKRPDLFNFVFVDKEEDSDVTMRHEGGMNGSQFSLKNNKTLNTYSYSLEGSHTNSNTIPYPTGIYQIDNNFINKNRGYLLSFVGGNWRGHRRNFLEKISQIKDSLENIKYKSVYYCPLLTTSNSHELAMGWEEGAISTIAKKTYYNSVFSWQPGGDSITRRGFYEAILMGNIPVISERFFELEYGRLLLGKNIVKDICLIVNEGVMNDAEELIKFLLCVEEDEISHKQEKIKEYSPRLQWNFCYKDNAFNDMLNHCLTGY